MMSILSNIRTASFIARKNRESEKAASLIMLLSEASMVGKNDGDRETTDVETIAVIKKFIKNIDETLAAGKFAHGDPRAVSMINEKSMFNSFLPKQLTEDEIRVLLIDIAELCNVKQSPKAVSEVLKVLKSNYEGQYDGATAARLAKEVVA